MGALGVPGAGKGAPAAATAAAQPPAAAPACPFARLAGAAALTFVRRTLKLCPTP